MRQVTMVVLSLFFGLQLAATNPSDNSNLRSILDEIGYKEVVNIEINADLDALTSDYRNADKHKATLSFEDAQGAEQVWDVKLTLRGKFRRMHCAELPPLKVDFDKDDLRAAGLAKFDDFKLVNYCLSDKEQAKELLVKEYLAYKMYNQLTPLSFDVQLLRITYKDTKTNRRVKQLAFLIEDTGSLKARIGAEKFEKPLRLEHDMFDDIEIQTMALFQYMIGNTDWKLNIEKNVKLLKTNHQLVAIPYDFDFSGLVNPSYGVANTNLQLTTLKERVFLGFSESAENMDVVIQLFQNKKEAIYSLISSNKHLKSLTKREMKDYLDSFYNNLNPVAIVDSIPGAE